MFLSLRPEVDPPETQQQETAPETETQHNFSFFASVRYGLWLARS